MRKSWGLGSGPARPFGDRLWLVPFLASLLVAATIFLAALSRRRRRRPVQLGFPGQLGRRLAERRRTLRRVRNQDAAAEQQRRRRQRSPRQRHPQLGRLRRGSRTCSRAPRGTACACSGHCSQSTTRATSTSCTSTWRRRRGSGSTWPCTSRVTPCSARSRT
jgi:hypothetical protein